MHPIEKLEVEYMFFDILCYFSVSTYYLPLYVYIDSIYMCKKIEIYLYLNM
jgi:hypothetical protein